MKYYYANLPSLGNVALSRHAQARAHAEGITDEIIAAAFAHGTQIDEGFNTLRIEHAGVSIVIERRPEPFKGAMLVKTIFRRQRN